MNNYAHSTNFAGMKNIAEQFDSNLTSAQYLQALDSLLFRAYAPIILATNSFDALVGQLIGWQETTRKRKVSFQHRDEFIPIALTWLCLPSREEKAARAVDLLLDRAALAEFVETFIRSMERFEQASNLLLTDQDGNPCSIEEHLAFAHSVVSSCGATSIGVLLNAITESKLYISRYHKFAEAIMTRFTRLCLMTAQRDYVNVFGHSIDLNDAVQVYMMVARRAIDKCDPRQGVLTSHIQSWLKSGRSIIADQQKGDGSAITLDDTEEEPYEGSEAEAVSRNEHSSRVSEIARLVDPEGYGRAWLGLNESPTWIRSQMEALTMHQ
jgi:hypothetical protein